MKAIKLNDIQLQALSGISADIGQAFLISSVIPFVLGLANPPILVVLLTLMNSIGFWVIAVALVGGKKK